MGTKSVPSLVAPSSPEPTTLLERPSWWSPQRWSIVFHKVSLEDYPWIRNTPMLTEYPGLALWELCMYRAVRYACSIGFAVSPFVWFLQRKRLPFADRPLFKLHHVFFPSAGYGTYAGFGLGTADVMWRCYNDFGGPTPSKEAERKLVKAAVLARMDKDNERWCNTAGRFAFCGMVTTYFFWKGGGPVFRAAMGFGTGVSLAGVVSISRIDKQIQLF
jgi:hypothetical protein